ncbi:MAG: transposase [Candidatus Kuenenbacteria bacterium]
MTIRNIDHKNNIKHRFSIRLKGYNYSRVWMYFVTICIKDRKCLLGNIINEKIILNELGRIVKKCWEEIIIHYPNIELDEFIIMPNHLHGIIFITDDLVRVQNFEPLQENKYQHIISGSIGAIIRGFKIGVKKIYRQSIWQRNYYEHIIRNENSLEKIRNYIYNNPNNWQNDIENLAINKNITEQQKENYYKNIF